MLSVHTQKGIRFFTPVHSVIRTVYVRTSTTYTFQISLVDIPDRRSLTLDIQSAICSPEVDAQGLRAQRGRQAPGAGVVSQHVVTLKTCSEFATDHRNAWELRSWELGSKCFKTFRIPDLFLILIENAKGPLRHGKIALLLLVFTAPAGEWSSGFSSFFMGIVSLPCYHCPWKFDRLHC